MPSTEEIMSKARELGGMIAEHETAKKLAETIEQLQADTDAQRAVHDLNRHYQALSEKQAAGKPIEVEDKRKLEKLQLAVAKNPLLGRLQMLQMDYVDLLRKVDDAIQGESGGDVPGAEAVSAPVNPDLSGLR